MADESLISLWWLKASIRFLLMHFFFIMIYKTSIRIRNQSQILLVFTRVALGSYLSHMNYGFFSFPGLKACAQCNNPLHLYAMVGEKLAGLGSYIRVQCIDCSHINVVATDRSHHRCNKGQPILDIHTKSGFGKFWSCSNYHYVWIFLS